MLRCTKGTSSSVAPHLHVQREQWQKRPLGKKLRAAEKSPVASSSVEDVGTEEEKRKADGKRVAVAAKISAARALARRLANEQQSAIAAARDAAGHSLDEEEVEAIKRSVAASTAAAARAAAEAGAKERQARKGAGVSVEQITELARLKEENEALQQLILEMASNKTDAKKRVSGLKEKYTALVNEIAKGRRLFADNGAARTARKEEEAAADALAASSEKEREILEVVSSLLAAQDAVDEEMEDQEEDKPSEEEDKDVKQVEKKEAAQKDEPKPATVKEEQPSPVQAALPSPAKEAKPSPTDEKKELPSPEKEGEPSPAEEEEQGEEEEEAPLDVRALAKKATSARQIIFYTPEKGIPIRDSGTLYYNAALSSLPGNRRLQFKAGVNKWVDILELDMQRATDLGGLEKSDWWSIDLCFDEDVFQVDFVIVERNSRAVDNNRGRDYNLLLSNALTEEEILEKQAAALAVFEEERLQMLDEEEEKVWQKQKAAAFKEADAARQQFKQDFEEKVWAEAAAAASKRRANLPSVVSNEALKGVLQWKSPPTAGRTAVALYNKNSGDLRAGKGVIMHVGFDGWFKGSMTQIQMTPVSKSEVTELRLSEQGDWWRGAIEAPRIAEVVDFVLSDPDRRLWDNNRNKDFHVGLRNALSREELIQACFDEAWEAQQKALEDGQDNAAKRTIRKMEEKAKALRKRREVQHQVFYTEPATPLAGQPVTLFYNPDVTALRGRPEVWVTGSFNRWMHKERFGPIQMQPVIRGGAGFCKATVQVPEDAWVLDFVLSDSADGGAFFDNNNGMDYHIDVAEGSIKRPPLRIVHIAVEMAPIAKVGGMGDVVTALSRAVKEAGHEVTVILPKYDVINYAEVKGIKQTGDFFWNNTQIKVWEGFVEGLPTTFLEPCNGSVWAGCIYGRNDDAARFGFFCGAALEYLKHHSNGPMPNIIHAHDWQSAQVAFGDVHPAKSIFTIHNMEFGVDQIGRAVAASGVSTTVSPTYAVEVSGHPAIAPHLGKFFGIRNGIDQEIWDPLFDRFLPRGYSAENVSEGKGAAKDELRRRMDLSFADVPLVSVVTRLTHQKGIHLIKHAAWRTLERGGQFVLLGSAPDPRIQGDFNALAGEIARQYPDRARFWFAYDEPLSHLIYAGSDVFLVPSMFEPCGLTQMIAMRYGTVPVVRKTGGLNDTVFDIDDDKDRAIAAGTETNGFSFVGADAAGLDYALNRALELWYTDKEIWHQLTQRVMGQDWSWAEPALDYCEIYYKALKGY